MQATRIATPFLKTTAGADPGRHPERPCGRQRRAPRRRSGCGDRGTGNHRTSLAADSRRSTRCHGRHAEDRVDQSLETLQQTGKISRPSSPSGPIIVLSVSMRTRELLGSGVDVVLLCTPPHFRPILRAAVEAGKHVFAEKPVGVDAPGVHSVLKSCELARSMGLSVVAGLCLRYDNGISETVRRIHDGAIGDVVALFANDYRAAGG